MNTKTNNNQEYQPVLRKVEKENFMLVISRDVEAKIRFWCGRLPNNEWSGVLFYKTEGTFGKEGFVATAVDFIVMDIGSSVHTQFDESNEMVSYMAENDLLDCKTGILHSHNHMSVFYSGEDENTILKEGIDRVHFLSLVVNNAGDRIAAMTRRVRKVITVADEGYQTFGGMVVTGKPSTVCERDVIEMVYADIITDGERDDSSRLKELLDRQRVVNSKVNTKIDTQPSLFDNYNQYRINVEKADKTKAKAKTKDVEDCLELTYYYNLVLTGDTGCPCDVELSPVKSMDALEPLQSNMYESLIYSLADSAAPELLEALVDKLSAVNGFQYVEYAAAIIQSYFE